MKISTPTALSSAAPADVSFAAAAVGTSPNAARADHVHGFAPSGLIAMWSGTIAAIPSGWLICDGNNGTPNLLAKFVKGVATAATNPGATGGSATHSHTAHTAMSVDASMGAEGVLTATPVVNSKTHSTENNEPAYYAIAYIMKA